MQQDYRCGELLVMFLAGLTIGTTAGLLLAPHSGAYTRRQIQNLAEDVKEQASNLASEACCGTGEADCKLEGSLSRFSRSLLFVWFDEGSGHIVRYTGTGVICKHQNSCIE